MPHEWEMDPHDRVLTVSPPAPDHLAWVTHDEFLNAYEGCGYDTVCNYIPRSGRAVSIAADAYLYGYPLVTFATNDG